MTVTSPAPRRCACAVAPTGTLTDGSPLAGDRHGWHAPPVARQRPRGAGRVGRPGGAPPPAIPRLGAHRGAPLQHTHRHLVRTARRSPAPTRGGARWAPTGGRPSTSDPAFGRPPGAPLQPQPNGFADAERTCRRRGRTRRLSASRQCACAVALRKTPACRPPPVGDGHI